ncbi:MAG: hypothetical protein ACOC5M_02500 [Chloroflexota bacterium]
MLSELTTPLVVVGVIVVAVVGWRLAARQASKWREIRFTWTHTGNIGGLEAAHAALRREGVRCKIRHFHPTVGAGGGGVAHSMAVLRVHKDDLHKAQRVLGRMENG